MRCAHDGRTIGLAAAALVLASCASTPRGTWIELKADAGSGPTFQITGTVHRLDLEGGVWVIRDTEGTNYQPSNLPDAFRVEGIAVEAAARRRDNLVSVGMVGPLVDLLRIRQRSSGKALVSGTVGRRERMALPAEISQRGVRGTMAFAFGRCCRRSAVTRAFPWRGRR